MIFSNLTKREKNLFYLAMFLIFVWITHNFVIKPIIVKWKELDDKIEEKSLKLEKNIRMIDRKERIEHEYENYASAVKMGGSEEEEMAKFLTEVESLASSSSTHIIEIKPRPSKKIQFYKKYLIDLDAEGDINQLSKFIYDIQNSSQLLKVDKFSLGTKGAGTNLLKCRLLVSKILIP